MDRWGGIGPEDFNAATNMINRIQVMGDRADARQESRDVDTNFELLTNPAKQTPVKAYGGAEYETAPEPGAMESPALVGSAKAQVGALGLAAQKQQVEKTMAQDKESLEIKDKAEKIFSWMAQNGGPEAIDNLPSEYVSGITGHKALAYAMEIETGKEENQLKLLNTRMDKIKTLTPVFMAQREYIQDAWLSGREEDAVNGLIQMSKTLPLPHQLGEYNSEDKTFDVQYFDRRTGAFQSTKRIPVNDLMAELYKTGEKELAGGIILGWEAKRLENLKAEASPIRGKTKGGTSVLITPLLPPTRSDGNLSIRVKDENTGQLLAEYKTWEALYDSGTQVEDLNRDKDMGDIALKEQQIKTSKASEMSHNRANQGDGALSEGTTSEKDWSKFLDNSKKEFGIYLQHFAQPGDDPNLIGNMDTQEFKGAMTAAVKFYDENKDNVASMSETEKLRFDSARSAIILSQQVNQKIANLRGIPGMEVKPEPAEKPVTLAEAKGMGAKQLPDGRWAIPAGKGKAKIISIIEDQKTATSDVDYTQRFSGALSEPEQEQAGESQKVDKLAPAKDVWQNLVSPPLQHVGGGITDMSRKMQRPNRF